MVAEHLAQRGLEQVRRGVVRDRREAGLPRDNGADAVAGCEPRPFEDERLVIAEAMRGAERRNGARVLVHELPRVRHLAASVGVERRLAQLRQKQPVAQFVESGQLGEHLGLLVADELGAKPSGSGEVGSSLEVALLAPGPRHLAVALHQLAEPVDVDRLPALLGELFGQLDREPERCGERERVVGRDRRLPGELVEDLEPARKCLARTAPPRAGRRARSPRRAP